MSSVPAALTAKDGCTKIHSAPSVTSTVAHDAVFQVDARSALLPPKCFIGFAQPLSCEFLEFARDLRLLDCRPGMRPVAQRPGAICAASYTRLPASVGPTPGEAPFPRPV